MRILVLTFYFEPDLSAGSFRTTAFVKELEKNISDKDTIEIISTMPNRYSSFNETTQKSEKLAKNIQIDRINLGTHKSGFIDQSKLFFKFVLEVFKIIKKREKYDVVYATSSRLMTAFLGALISNKQKAKLYLDIRDIFTDTLESLFKNSKLRYIIPLFKQIEKYTINSAKHVNLVSRGFENYFKNINNKIGYSFYSNGIDDIFLNYDFSKEVTKKKIITYAGNIGEGQGLEKIIPHMAKGLGDNYEIQIFGDGGRKRKLQESVEGIKNVKLFDPINRTKLLEIYKNSDILFLHLNDFDAFKKVLPSKLFEYGATNKFIIAGVNGYAKEFINNNISNSIVFTPCNVDDFFSEFAKIESFDDIDREKFICDFKRENIMKSLSQEVYEV